MDGSSFDFMSNPIVPGQSQQQIQMPMNNLYASNVRQMQAPSFPNMVQQQSVQTSNEVYQPKDKVSVGGFSFTVVPDNDEPEKVDKKMTLENPGDVQLPEQTKRRGRPKKNNEVDSNEIVRAEGGTVEEVPTMYSYAETTNMTRTTINQIDLLASEVKEELDAVRMSRTLKRRNDYIVGLSGTLGNLLSTKLTAIREINNSISKSNELDYKISKDRKSSEDLANDDKRVMDLYNAFITNPGNNPNQVGILGPSGLDATVVGSQIVRADSAPSNNGMTDMGYLQYVSNMTPEQRMMYYEQDPNIKQVVVYDASTGNKFFQVMNVKTGEVITGVPVRDQMFMEDTTIDLRTKIAKNININETYPVIVINDNITSQY